MSTITIRQLEPDIAKQLEQRAAQHGHTIEAEIKAILKSVLALEPNLVEAIEKHFVYLGKFELPEIPREPMREPPSFEISEV
jgi:plasmid stability protein